MRVGPAESTHLPRASLFGECITRTCTLRAIEKNALNLSQGFPEEEPDAAVLRAACEALSRGPNQYADMRGAPALRRAIAESYHAQGMDWVDPDRHVTVTCGATEAMAATMLALAGPGDEVAIQEPTYENYPPQALIAGAGVKWMRSSPPEWAITRDALTQAFSTQTRVAIVNNPNNPTGRVYSREELMLITEFCLEHQTIAVVDEIYERLIWGDRPLIHVANLPHMRDRTVTISGISKTYRATGWRVGWAVATENITRAIRRVHDFLTATVPTPLQAAAVAALSLPEDYYVRQVVSYKERKCLLSRYLVEAGLVFADPEGSYYFFPRIEGRSFPDSEKFANALLDDARVAVVPYTAFYRSASEERFYFRINFAKHEATLHEAGKRLVAFAKRHGT